MSTRATCPDKESLVSFLYDEFDGSEAFDRRSIARHLDGCERCAREAASLGGVRAHLRAWEAPDTRLAFRIVQDHAVHQHAAWWTSLMKPAFPLAAAAVLVLGAGLGLAKLDVQYDANGLRVRTGWSREDAAAALRGQGQGLQGTAISAAGTPSLLAPPDKNRTPWQADLQQLAQGLRQEFAASRQQTTGDAAKTGGGPLTASDAAFLRRVQQMIDQAEVRQQQNLALRITELSRDFDLQRRSDLAQIEQGFGRLAGQRELDAQQQRLLLNAIRASQQVPPR